MLLEGTLDGHDLPNECRWAAVGALGAHGTDEAAQVLNSITNPSALADFLAFVESSLNRQLPIDDLADHVEERCEETGVETQRDLIDHQQLGIRHQRVFCHDRRRPWQQRNSTD